MNTPTDPGPEAALPYPRGYAGGMALNRYVIVGGVAGGMSAAARLRRLDESAEIIILEQGGEVSYASCGLPYFVGGEITEEAALLVQTPASLRASLNLDVRVHHTVTALDPVAKTVHVEGPDGASDLPYDELILSPGARAARPPIPGLDHPRVHTLRSVPDALTMRDFAREGRGQAVVLGAGFIGLETAEGLRQEGIEVTLVEAVAHVLPPLEPELAWLLREELVRLGIDVRDAMTATAIDDADGRAVVRLADGSAIEADLVVLSAGTTPNTEPFAAAGVSCDGRGNMVVDERGRTNVPHVWAIGDATVSRDAVTGTLHPVALAGPANRAGRLVADAIVRPSARRIPSAYGTAVVRVGSQTAALTGANREALVRAGIAFTTMHLHPMHHASYFPGAAQMHLVVHIDPKSGRLLGAQAVGEGGVDKRIDVLATAMRAGLAAPDLIDLDLCYAPPYGSAKDPVTMVGFTADNVLTGQVELWQPGELDWARREAFVLDVRTPREFATGHLPEALNVPHTKLRGRLAEVAAAAGGRPIAVMCQSGVRSYIAHRVLVAAGLPSQTLSGGMLTLRAWLGASAAEVLVSEDAR